MDAAEWDSVLQYISEPADFTSPRPEKPVSEMAGISLQTQPPTPVQVLTPPVRTPPAHAYIARLPSLTFKDSDKDSPPHFQSDILPDGHVPGNTIVSVSTSFHPDASLLAIPPDVILVSSDGVFFFAHTTQILAVSTNSFNNLVPPKPSKSKQLDDHGPIVPLPEVASVLNIILHVVYEIPCSHYHPSIETIAAAVDAMDIYGLPPKSHIAPSTPLYSYILSQAPIQPIVVYALASAHDLYELAVPVSSHLLSFALHSLTDEIATRIGPVYMKRLFFLHLGRLDALKRLLLPPPHPHPPIPGCDFTEQKKLTRAWALASAYLAWDARPGTHPPLKFRGKSDAPC